MKSTTSSPLYRPAKPKPTEDAESEALRSRVNRLLAEVRPLAEVQAAILMNMRKSLEALKKLPGDMYTRKWFAEREAAIRAEAFRALNAAEEAAQERIEHIREVCQEAIAPAPGSVADRTLQAIELQNAWLAMRPHFDAVRDQADGIAAIERACAAAGDDAVKLAAIKQFAPDHLAAQFVGLPRADKARVQEALSANITAVEAQSWTPAQRTGHELLGELDRGVGRLMASSHEVEREAAGGSMAPRLAAWEDSQFIDLAYRGKPVPAELVTPFLGPEARAWEIAASRNYPLLTEQGALRDTILSSQQQQISAAQIIRGMGGTIGEGEPPAS